MGIHSDTDIYKATYSLLQYVMLLVKNMPRDFKQALGAELRDECIKITVLILRANTAQDKTPHLSEIRERHQVVELLIRLSRDLKLISQRQYAEAIEMTGSIGKQANGWLGFQRQTHEGQGHHDRALF
jgi:hypothetical protein